VKYGYEPSGATTNRGLLTSVTHTAGGLPKSISTGSTARVTTLDYDASGQRILKQDPDGETRYVPGLYERRQLTAAPGALEHMYRIYAGGREVAQVQRVEQGGTIIDKPTYLHHDALGSTTLITDSHGASLHTQRYHPFGKSDDPASGATGVNVGFTGHDDEAELGLVNMKGRLYDPTTGRFTTPDPFVQAAG
jgi:RHS repeat-associated protein